MITRRWSVRRVDSGSARQGPASLDIHALWKRGGTCTCMTSLSANAPAFNPTPRQDIEWWKSLPKAKAVSGLVRFLPSDNSSTSSEAAEVRATCRELTCTAPSRLKCLTVLSAGDSEPRRRPLHSSSTSRRAVLVTLYAYFRLLHTFDVGTRLLRRSLTHNLTITLTPSRNAQACKIQHSPSV